jgi:tetratricopeptide (TPR) repeat protein
MPGTTPHNSRRRTGAVAGALALLLSAAAIGVVSAQNPDPAQPAVSPQPLLDAAPDPGTTAATGIRRVTAALGGFLAELGVGARPTEPTVLDGLIRNAGRDLADDTGEIDVDALVHYARDALNLRVYPPSRLPRLPAEVVSDRGGTELEIALALAVLVDGLGLEPTIVRRPTGEPTVAVRIAPSGGPNRIVSAAPREPTAVGAWNDLTVRQIIADIIDGVFIAVTERAGIVIDLMRDGSPPAADAARLADLWRLRSMATAAVDLRETLDRRWNRYVVTVLLLDVLPDTDDRRRELTAERDRQKSALRRVVADSRDPQALHLFAQLLLREADVPGAIEALRRLVAGHPVWRPAQGRAPIVQLAGLLAGRGEWDEAVELYVRAEEQNAGLPSDWLAGGLAAEQAGDLDVADRLLALAESGGLQSAPLYTARGRVTYRRAIAQDDPAGPVALDLMVRATAQLRAAARLDPGAADAHLWLLRVLATPFAGRPVADGDIASAVDAALAGAPDNADLWRVAAAIRRDLLGDAAGARTALRRYLELRPNDARAERALSALSTGDDRDGAGR